MSRSKWRPIVRRGEAGGVALEYVLVTTFALATTLAAIGYLGKTLKSRFEELEATSIRTPSGESIWDP
jgi:Flp pilus assembly pilin Flp